MKPTVKCPECYDTNLYKFYKYKYSNQKYQCKKCRRQFTLQSIKRYQLVYPKCPVCGKGTYLYHKYKYHVGFKCNHIFKQIIPTDIDNPSCEKLNGKAIFSGHRCNLNIIISAINLCYSLNATTIAISTYLLDYMNIKVSHVTISKWIKKFDKYFKSISDELTTNL